MAYDPAFTEDIEWSSEEQITSTKLDAMANNEQHNYDFGIHCGDSPPGKLKMARGEGYVTWDGVSGDANVTITFATDAEDGDPAFTTLPTILLTAKGSSSYGGNEVIGGNYIMYVNENNSTNLVFEAVIFSTGTPTNGYRTYFNWLAIGY